MTLEEFLEKYNCAMTPNEINEITDNNIRNIKQKYWELKHKSFLDEQNISDQDLGNVYDELTQQEKEELIQYYNSKE